MNHSETQGTFTLIGRAEYARRLRDTECPVPFEATPHWEKIDALSSGRELFGNSPLLWEKDGFSALLQLKRYRIKHLNFLWSRGGPVWNRRPDSALEWQLFSDLREYVKQRDRKIDFLRIQSFCEIGEPDCQHLSYDSTVVINLEDGPEAVKRRMKSRGRRDVNKALRECGGECREETQISCRDFAQPVALLKDTAQRKGFSAKNGTFYFSFLQTLRNAENPLPVRLFTYREEGKVQAWAMFTVYGTQAYYYFAASARAGQKNLAAERLLWHACTVFMDEGIKTLDLMGIGSKLAPHLNTLNIFKTKFSTETVSVPPYRDLPIRKRRYRLLNALCSLKQKITLR